MATGSRSKSKAASNPTGSGVPTLESLVGSILDRLPSEAVAAIAGMGPVDESGRETFEGQVTELARALAIDRVCGVDHAPNAATARAIRDARAGRGVTAYPNLADALADLGI